MNAVANPIDRDQPSSPEHDQASIGWHDRSLQLLLLIAFVLQLLSWSQLKGYQLADSVEYMERAQALVRGVDVVDSVDIRGFGFVSLFTPLFALADLFSVEDFRPIVGLARILQMLLGLELVRITVLLGAKLAGRKAGLVAGLAVAFNPYFLLYSASPVSGIAAGACIAHALYRLLFRTRMREAVIGGLWLGGALLVAYKTILIALPILFLLFLSDRFKRWQSWFGASAGYAIGALIAVALDKLCYGVWGQSIELYLRQNFGQIATRICLKLGLYDTATWFWEFTGGGSNALVKNPSTVPSKLLREPNALYHLTHLHEMVAWPLLLLLLFGIWRAVFRGDRAIRMLTVVGLISLAAISLKKSHDFRLLLPILPVIGVLCGIGWQALFGQRLQNVAIAFSGIALIVAGGLLGWIRLGELNNSPYSGYWRAMDRVNQLARLSSSGLSGGPNYRAACAWNWAVFMRDSAQVDLVKLPHQIDRWPALGADERTDDLSAIGTLDAFITHLAVLLASPELFDAVNAQFEVDSVLYNRRIFEDLGPIIVFKRRSGSSRALTFQNRTSGVAPDLYASQKGLNPGLSFEGPDLDAKLTLVGWKYEALPGDGHGWLSLHWYLGDRNSPPPVLVRPRILTQFVDLPWEEQHLFGRHFPSSKDWRAGDIVSEGWPVVAAVAPFDASQPWRPLFPDQEPGTTFPGSFWLRITPLRSDGTEALALIPIEPITANSEPRPISDSFVRIGDIELIVPNN